MDGKQSSTSKTDYKIRKGEPKDIPVCVKLAEQGSYEVEIHAFDEDHVFLLTKKIQKDGVGVVLEADGEQVGYIGGVILPHPYDPRFNILQTCSYYIKPKHRNVWAIKLLKLYIEEAKKKDIHIVRMQARFAKDPVKMTKLYERFGFEAQDITFDLDIS